MPTGPLAAGRPLCGLAPMATVLACRARPPWSAVLPDVAVGLDALLADLVGDLPLVGDRVGLQAHALLGDGALLDHRLLGPERHLVLLLRDVAAGECGVAVGVRDRLALDADLLALHRDGRGDVLGDD